jgi:aerobic carbon-monoxide dehydrogenase medium subunit
MYPPRFHYEAPRSVEEAVALLGQGNGDAKVLAGGQSLIPMMKLRFAAPALLVDINNIPGLDHLERDGDGTIRIGALCRHEHLEKSAMIAEHQPTIAAAAHLVADPIVRTRGTFVGSLCHADPQGDWAACAIALDGGIVAQGPGGRRSIPAKQFVTGPFQTALAPDEIAVEAVIPAPRGTARGGYLKLERRIGDFATAGVAVALDEAGGQIVRAGIALVGVGGRTIDAPRQPRRWSVTRSTRPRSSARPSSPRPPRSRAATTGAVRRTSATSSGRSPSGFSRESTVRTGRRPEMSSLFNEVAPAPAADVPTRRVTITVNGETHTADIEPRLLLAHLLRQGLRLTGTHTGCDTTNCGACTVLVDGRPVKSCTMLAVQADGHEVTTVEGLGTPSALHPVQEGFKDEHGLQCGFCTPGMMLSAKALLDENPDPTEDEVRWALSGNLCRCTGYQNIVKAVLWAAEKMRDQAPEPASEEAS